MTHRVISLIWALAAALIMQAALPHVVWAQDRPTQAEPTPEELAAARKLFVEGKELETTGQWAEALEKFETVAKVKMTPQVRFHIALCHENLGRLVEAVNGFELAEQEARAAGDKARDVEENAPKRAAALRERVAQLTLSISGKMRVSKIYLDGRPVTLIDKPIPVDPGEHLVEVKRDDEVTFSETLFFEEADTHALTLEIDDPEPPPPPPDPTPDPTPDTTTPTPDEKPPQWIAYIVAGTGVAALVVGGVVWSVRQSELDKIAAECDDPENFTGCNPRFEPTAAGAENLDTAAKVLFGVGAAGVAAGVALWFLFWPDDDPQPTTGNTVSVVPSPTGVHIIGAF